MSIDILLAILSGLVSAAFTLGGLYGMLKRAANRAESAHARIDAHIQDHAHGQFLR